MTDFSKLSNEELEAIAAGKPAPKAPLDMSSLTDKQLEAMAANRKPLEFEDAPTTGQIELPGLVRLPKWMGGNDDAPMSIEGKFATLYGTLSTDNPRARQEIYEKHLPGAKAVDDKFGNPMIEYKGKRYYTARPGEFDLMDAGRLTAGVAGSLPAMAVAPASVLGSMAAAGGYGVAQSLAEDAVTIASGGKSQDLDWKKALVSGGIGALIPGGVATVVPIARRLYGRVAGEIFDAAGQPTARGVRILREAGMTADQIDSLTPAMRQEITQAVNSHFGSARVVGPTYRQALGDEFGVPQTTGGLLDDPTQLGVEKAIRGGQRGEAPQRIVQEFDQAQGDALSAAQEALRARAGGGRVLAPDEAGDVVAGEFRAANTAARNEVTAAYDRALLDPDAVVRAGGAPNVEIERIQGLPNAIEDWFMHPTRAGGTLIPTAENTPTTMQAIDRLRRFSETGSIPSAFPKATDAATAARTARMPGEGPTMPTAVGWEQIDLMRKQLSRLQRSIPNTPERATDRTAMRTVMNAFDEHLADRNPLLREAIDSAAQRFRTFRPDKQSQTTLTQDVLRSLNKSPEALEGSEVFNKLLGGRLASGEALGAVQHLTRIHPPGSAGHNAMAEQALRKIFVNPRTGDALTPQQMVTNIDRALGDRQGPVYRELLSQDQIARLMRFRELADNIASAARNINPSGSGHVAVGEARKAANKAMGGSAGAWIANILFNNPVAHAVGGGLGTLASTATGNAMNLARAANAVAPPPNLGGISTGTIAGRTGLLAQQPTVQSQPLDRLWQGLLQP